MDTDRKEGMKHEVKGAVKEVAGKVTGDAKLQVEGAADKARTAGQRQQGSAGAHRTASMRSCGTNISSR